MEKRLYRSSHDRVLLGVCGGMGEYFNTDPVIVRVIAVVITVLTGFVPGIIAYLIIALVIPLEGSTVSNPKDNIRENIADLRDTTIKFGQDIQTSFENKPTGTEGARPTSSSSNSYGGIIVLGLIIIALGLLFLLGSIFGWFWRFVWPVLLIVAGLAIILLVVRRR